MNEKNKVLDREVSNIGDDLSATSERGLHLSPKRWAEKLEEA